ncbi:aminopeptidase [Tundrisphaera lichenicola]|uniref:aminopeptidase n=1 Tax=Tundrisphaera lichenicola TaxID=2029860 RepID=UPI003EC04D4D
MTDDLIGRWATLLVDYCLRVEPGETILIASELEARPLVEACYREVVRRGAHPIVRVELPGLSEFFLANASVDQLAHLSPVSVREAEVCDGRIRISAESDTRSMRGIDPQRQASVDRARAPLRELAGKKRWVLTQYPTAAYAADAGMARADYDAYVASAMFLDRDDPVAAWKALGQRQAGLVDYMTGVSEVRIEGEGTDLTLSVAGRTWINSDGRRNMPSGEIFTGPVEESVRGKLRCSFPVCRSGRELVGIALEFEGGKVVSARADEGEDYLLSMLDLDPGARRLGELGIGLNAGIDRITGSILFDEKIGGTVHLALGNSYPETGGTNTSALHWDLIVDLRRGGRVTADGRLVMEDGRWLVG